MAPTEYNLLAELSVHAGQVLTYEHLMQRVWGIGNRVDSRRVRNHLMRLRRQLGEDAASQKYIYAGPRLGYRMAVGETMERDQGTQ